MLCLPECQYSGSQTYPHGETPWRFLHPLATPGNSTMFNFIITMRSTFVSIKCSINCNMNIGLITQNPQQVDNIHLRNTYKYSP